MSLYAPVVDGFLAGPPTTLPAALADVYGCGNAAVARLTRDGWRVVVRRAGSAYGPLEHVPTGRSVQRRLTWRAQRAVRERASAVAGIRRTLRPLDLDDPLVGP